MKKLLSQQGGLVNEIEAKAIAKHFFTKYSQTKEQKETQNISNTEPMMKEAYKCMNIKNFSPTQNEQKQYHDILDANGDGQVTLQDIEYLAIKYLSGLQDPTNTSDQSQEQQIISQTSQYPQKSNTTVTTTTVTEEISTKEIGSFRNSRTTLEDQMFISKRLFDQFDTEKLGYLQGDQVKKLMQAHYENIGIKYEPTEQDVQDYMKQTDLDGDGKLSYEEYSYVMRSSLTSAGISDQTVEAIQ